MMKKKRRAAQPPPSKDNYISGKYHLYRDGVYLWRVTLVKNASNQINAGNTGATGRTNKRMYVNRYRLRELEEENANVDVEEDQEENDIDDIALNKWTDPRKLERMSLSMLTKLITNPFPGFALSYRWRQFRPRIVLSSSMAQELTWRVLRTRFWPQTEGYFKTATADRRRLILDVLGHFDASFFWGLTKKFIEGQIHLIHSMVIRPRREFEDVLSEHFTRIRRFSSSSAVGKIVSNNGQIPVCIHPKNDFRRLDDNDYSFLDDRITTLGREWSNFGLLPHQIAVRAYFPPKGDRTPNANFVENGLICSRRYWGLRSNDLGLSSDLSQRREQNNETRAVYEQIFHLASNPNPTQIILDKVAERIVISSSMCHELCWIYLPTCRLRFLRRRRKELSRAMYAHLSQYYVGIKRADVEQGLLFLLNLIESERSRGLKLSEILCDERREEIFESRSEKHRLWKRINVVHYELCDLLLGDGNPSEEEVSSAISGILYKHSWSIDEVVKSCPNMVLEWRDRFLTRDWEAIVRGLICRHPTRLLMASGYEQMCRQNLRRLLTEMIRYHHCSASSSLSRRKVAEAMEETGLVTSRPQRDRGGMEIFIHDIGSDSDPDADDEFL